jgi:type IX secretion system PorP/SprF family membrane protein
MKKFFTLIIIIANISTGKGHCQDFTFSQFYEMPLLRNPALAGVFNGDIRISGAYRSQWGSITVPYKTTALSVEYKFPFGNSNDFLTTAVEMSNDIAGDIRLKKTQLLPAINFHKSLSDERDSYLSLAFMGGPAANQFDPTQMRLADQWRNGAFNPFVNSQQKIERTGYSYWDASTGLSFSSDFGESSRYYVGAALYHFNKPKVAFNSINSNVFLNPRYIVNAGLNTRFTDYNRITCFADYISEGGNSQLLAGLMYGTDVIQYYEDEKAATTLYFGAFVRWNDAVIPMVKLDMKKLSIGLSYDVNISKLYVASNWRGGFELTAAYKGFLKTRSSTLDRVRCVRF